MVLTLDVQGASFAEREARAGHVSLVLDRLGYDSSDKRYGFKSCLGGQADIAQTIAATSHGVTLERTAPEFAQKIWRCVT